MQSEHQQTQHHIIECTLNFGKMRQFVTVIELKSHLLEHHNYARKMNEKKKKLHPHPNPNINIFSLHAVQNGQIEWKWKILRIA